MTHQPAADPVSNRYKLPKCEVCQGTGKSDYGYLAINDCERCTPEPVHATNQAGEGLAAAISRVAGCQVGSDRSKRLVDFIVARDAALSTQPATSQEGRDCNGHMPNRYVPSLPAGSSLFAVNPITAVWHYVNHAGMWQGMPSPLAASGTELGDYDYNEMWNAIAKATRIDGGIIAISVRAFRAALAATPPPPTLSEDAR